jgi:ferredoxin-NADP reductase
LAAWAGWRSFRIATRHFEDESETQCSIVLEPVDGLALTPFSPGQFLTFSLPSNSSEPALLRCYSISDRPRTDHYRITVKRALAPAPRPDVAPGIGSSWFLDTARVGDLVQVRAPAGQFVIDDDVTVPAVFIAGGIGITPMLSMILWCLEIQPTRVLHLYYGMRNTAEYAFRATLAALVAAHPNFHMTVVFSGPWPTAATDKPRPAPAFIDVDLLRRTLPAGRHRFHVCGPAVMMESLVPALSAWGVPAADIHFEAFGPATVRSPLAPAIARPATPLSIRFRASGRTIDWTGDDANLLDLAERHGIVVEAGCRAGSCGSCETRLLSGSVDYPKSPDFAVSQGHCLLCVSTPTTPIELDA